MHDDIKNSGLGKQLSISKMTTNLGLSKFLGKRIRVKRELLTPRYIELNGSLIIDSTYTVKEVQKIYDGRAALRGYRDGDTFGRPFLPEEIEIV